VYLSTSTRPTTPLPESRLYGKRGELHLRFDHERLSRVLRRIPHKWLLTYDDCAYIRELYADFTQLRWTLQYGMNNYKQPQARPGRELFIANYIESQSPRPTGAGFRERRCEVRCGIAPNRLGRHRKLRSTPATEVEEHQQQIGVVYDTILIEVGAWVAAAKGEQHIQQVAIVHAAVAVHIPLAALAVATAVMRRLS
jgi:hypothetical protein